MFNSPYINIFMQKPNFTILCAECSFIPSKICFLVWQKMLIWCIFSMYVKQIYKCIYLNFTNFYFSWYVSYWTLYCCKILSKSRKKIFYKVLTNDKVSTVILSLFGRAKITEFLAISPQISKKWSHTKSSIFLNFERIHRQFFIILLHKW